MHEIQIEEPGCFFCLKFTLQTKKARFDLPEAMSLGNEMLHSVLPLVLCHVQAS